MWKLMRLWKLAGRQARLAWAVLRDARTPWSAKAATVFALLYVLVPSDVVTDFLPVLGWLDDGLVVYILLQLAFKLLPPELYESVRMKVEQRGGKAAPSN